MSNWFGPITCSNCELPVDIDTQICPHCYSSAPSRGPWQGTWSAFGVMVAVGLVVFAGAWASDHFFDTKLVGMLQSLFTDQKS